MDYYERVAYLLPFKQLADSTAAESKSFRDAYIREWEWYRITGLNERAVKELGRTNFRLWKIKRQAEHAFAAECRNMGVWF
jgi:hypothetical protein